MPHFPLCEVAIYIDLPLERQIFCPLTVYISAYTILYALSKLSVQTIYLYKVWEENPSDFQKLYIVAFGCLLML